MNGYGGATTAESNPVRSNSGSGSGATVSASGSKSITSESDGSDILDVSPQRVVQEPVVRLSKRETNDVRKRGMNDWSTNRINKTLERNKPIFNRNEVCTGSPLFIPSKRRMHESELSIANTTRHRFDFFQKIVIIS